MMRTTAKFNFRMATELKDRVDIKCRATRQSISSITTIIFQKWVNDEFEVERDNGSAHNGQALTHLDPDLFKLVMLKRQETGANVSAVARAGLRKWADGEWEVNLGPQ